MKSLLLFNVVIACCFAQEYNIPDSFVNVNHEFDFNVVEKLVKFNEGNLVYGFHPLHTILALTSVGARGDTAKQLKNALLFNSSDDQIVKDFQIVIAALKNTSKISIYTANKAYLADDMKIESNFVKTAIENFDAEVESVNFKAPKETSEKINKWVEKQTNDKIKNIITEDKIDGLTRFILINSLFFSAEWKHPFDVSATEKKDFYISKTETVKVDMMKLSADLLIDRHPDLKVTTLILPYQNEKAFLAILIPDEVGDIELAEKNLPAAWRTRNFTREYVKVYVPKFRVESTIDLIPPIKDMGVTDLFTMADLSGITKDEVSVSYMTQKTYIDINEIGTEAASVTALDGGIRSLLIPREEAYVFNVNRPFLFAIMYEEVGLLGGRITNPSKTSLK